MISLRVSGTKLVTRVSIIGDFRQEGPLVVVDEYQRPKGGWEGEVRVYVDGALVTSGALHENIAPFTNIYRVNT